MSIWTQINGCIRIDGIPSLEPKIEERVREILGRTCDYKSGVMEWDECTVPCGSEGSLQYELITAGDGLVLYTVAVWGDLRDFDTRDEEDLNAIVNWFDRVTVDSDLFIRSAILQYQTSCLESQILQYKRGD